jgi:catechol 2,3-dioxygenase-like lactoylglutathione lyase family enzyme
MQVAEVLETCLYAADLDAAAAFYGDVLGLHEVSRVAGRHVFFRCGSRMLLLFDPERTAEPGDVPPHGAHGPGHVAFGVPEAELDQWRAHLSTHGVAVEREAHWPRGGRSVYLRDPAGNSVELATPRIWGIAERDALGIG